ncbi:hypothetical protein [Chenggangzhangella methanolivorans]|uniref:Uncharacterized protein n=1 Tax=Chenggangzhangella methanolivorans TaxID=1437009 RepID=A0A9E6R8J6_9HYPH|nr:hypothetical protein [Chenggangzhangella methanolivorans]QZN98602.1 hypothetical protein K6K41_16370 [Chenggangzhangella methanolivorans]
MTERPIDLDVAREFSLANAALRDLAAGDGTRWKEAVGELHSQYGELPVWVLLHEDDDLRQTHAALCETLRPHMERLAPLQIVLLYEVVVGGEAFAARLSGNDAVFSAASGGDTRLTWRAQPRGLSTVFRSRDCRRTT